MMREELRISMIKRHFEVAAEAELRAKLRAEFAKEIEQRKNICEEQKVAFAPGSLIEPVRTIVSIPAEMLQSDED